MVPEREGRRTTGNKHHGAFPIAQLPLIPSRREAEAFTLIRSQGDGVPGTVASIHIKLTSEDGDEAVLESLATLPYYGMFGFRD